MIPSALLKRLAKRGIISKDTVLDNNSDSSESTDIPEKKIKIDGTSEINSEEIIAEDYDEYDMINPDAYEYPTKKKDNNSGWSDQIKRRMTARFGYQSVEGCQNKYNIYHKCTLYCVTRYGEVEYEIGKEYDKRHKRLMLRYPLPKNWKKVYDIGCKTFYYYNKETHLVTWLPPTHPDAKLSKSAKSLRRELLEHSKETDENEEQTPQAFIVESYPPLQKAEILKDANPTLPESLKPPIVLPPKKPYKKSKSRDLEKAIRSKNDRGSHRTKHPKSSALDPMDPAAYSDVPRGTWASGLTPEDRKTGVDTTAPGQLFQSRPYPSPGAVLQANSSNKKSKAVSDDEEENVKVSLIKEYNIEDVPDDESD